MNSASPTPSAGRDIPAARPASDTSPTTTPNADMQADDVGTADSGAATTPPDSATAATRAMKQTSKTAAESGKRR